MANITNEDKIILEAETVYLLMKKGFPISRNVRAQWMLEHLDSVINIENCTIHENDDASELEIVSVLPKNRIKSWSVNTSHQFLYKVVAATSIIFLAHKYRIVFNLDFSPSLATVDIEHGEIVVDEVCVATKRFLEGITKPFTIPGSKRVMQPDIYVTVIAHTPFFTNPAQQVLIQGWLITEENVVSLVRFIEKQLNVLEEKVASVTAIANQHLENLRAESERLVGGLFEETGTFTKNGNNCITNTSMVSPDASFINMLRYGMLALTLLPEHSCAHLVVVTDGIVAATDVHVLDSVIQQLRATTVACSFLHVGSAYHPHSGDGLVPYQDLLYFLSAATLGSYMTFMPRSESIEGTNMNIYHKNYLCWQLYRESLHYTTSKNNKWQLENPLFHGHKSTPLLRKKQIDDKVICTLSSLLCCRLREGYLIRRVGLRDDILEICFALLWKTNVILEYLVTCPWSVKSLSVSNAIQYTITIEAPYEFLHDVTCLSKKPLKSQYRQGVVSRFWTALTSLTESDNMLAHFSWFPGSGWTWYSVPDTIRSGMPVFYLSAYPSASTVQLSDAACPQFGQIWQPVVSLDPLQWSRWMHTQRITLILSHDRPLPRHLHQANQSGRFQCVQCRQAAAVLYAMLKNWATFVLVENHTYVQFIYREAEKPPVSFSLIRINCKALCVVLNIAFAGGTEGVVRHNVVVDLIERLSKLTLPNRPTEQRETLCCSIIHKSLERFLIRYERMPTDLSMVVFPDGTQPILTRSAPILSGSLVTTLSRYLYHNRWLWHVKRPLVQTIPGVTLPRLNVTAIARILSTLTKMRLAEGFSFAYSAAGIINMVLEVQMLGPENCETAYPCIIQYILFPPHVISNSTLERDSVSDEDTDEGTVDGEISTEDCENSGEYQIVTEVWIEPQCGHVQIPMHKTAEFMHSLQYHQLPDAIAEVDEGCINALLTLEHLSLLCQIAAAEKSSDIVFGQAHQGIKLTEGCGASISKANECANSGEFFNGPPINDERIHNMHFSFDMLNILPKCQQAELLFSMFANGVGQINEDRENANRILMEGFLDRIKHLHSKELLLTSADSQKFTEMLLHRPRDDGPSLSFFAPGEKHYRNYASNYPRWRCFIKGISVTHIIVTILPASEKDVELVMHNDNANGNNVSDNCDRIAESHFHREQIGNSSPLIVDGEENCTENAQPKIDGSSFVRHSSTGNSSSKIGNHNICGSDAGGGLVIPVYVYDCSLAVLIEALVDKLQSARAKDIYQDHTFRIDQQEREEFITLKSASNTKPSSPEPKSEDSDNVSSDQRSLMEHCKLLSLAHCHCYVFAVYKSLTLQQALSYEDMEAAVEQCEETLIEINITNYLRSVCRHLSTAFDGSLFDQLKTFTCNDVLPLHNLIKEKFERIITIAFRPVPAHPEFYYCSPSWMSDRLELVDSQRSENGDEIEDFTFHSEIIDCQLDRSSGKANQEANATWPGTTGPKLSNVDSTESLVSDLQEENMCNKEQPLFLQLSCSTHFRSELCSTPVKLLPTCFTEVVQRMDDYHKDQNIAEHNVNELKVTLDIICLNLPREVLEVTLDHSPALRTTSYCSTSPLGSMRTESGSSPGDDTGPELLQEELPHLPLYQHNAVSNLTDEIEWLLQDETATALLDQESPTEETLRFVARHVSESSDRSSCLMDKVLLHFVFSSESSGPKFLDELKKLKIDKYCIRQESSLFYFVKNVEETVDAPIECTVSDEKKIRNIVKGDSLDRKDQEAQNNLSNMNRQDSGDPPGCYSEISSIGEGKTGTDDGYEGDSSNSDDDYQWLLELDKRRSILPNFWLILNVESSYVDVYFHCRFLELASPEVKCYSEIQKMAINQIKAICRRVNQYLLLQSLHDTRICDILLEPESNDDHTWRGEVCSDSGSASQNPNLITNHVPGMFRCPVIWEVQFCLHPRLKTGPGRSGLSRGIKALHAVLNRLSVNNRSNMFVYQENNGNVFYLRLHEQTSDGKSLQSKLSESDEKLVVSRSNSVASLAQTKGIGCSYDHIASNDTRPRVRSFGEKESDVLNKTGDSIILMVHGISDAGPEVKQDLVQVLQNRLDDAVLEVLSVMLARNPMCKLTPADVHFIQKPYRSPECTIQLSVQPHCSSRIGALGHYLRQNILQFLYTPKYTDYRAHYHFQDYSQLEEGSSKRVPESDIFLYNQSHSSGSKGIACIALAITNAIGEPITNLSDLFPTVNIAKSVIVEDFESLVSTSIYEYNGNINDAPDSLIEFRIWKQGRVNLESLRVKLCSAVKHGTWDFMTEYNLLSTPLTEPITKNIDIQTMPESEETEYLTKGTNVQLLTQPESLATNQYEFGEDGKLHEVYHTTLAQWFQFALEIGVPAVKKHEIIVQHRHSIPVIVRELQTLIRGHAPDTSCRAFVLRNRQPFINTDPRLVYNTGQQKCVAAPVYVPCDFSRDDQSTCTKCILAARNFSQWKASFSNMMEPELLVPKDQKLLQKFNPLILETNFVPRQRILLAIIQSDSITFYMYNWSKERSEKLIKQTTNLGNWLTSRSCLYTNIIMQKLGIFHHPPMRSYQQRQGNSSQCYQITDMESLTKFPQTLHPDNKDWARSSNRGHAAKSNPLSWNQLVGQAMRDVKPNIHYPYNTTDPVVKAACDLQDLRHREKKAKEDFNKLYAMWQSRSMAPNIPVPHATLTTFKQHSRLIHFCHTPLLFLPKWRLQSAATRDHSITAPASVIATSSVHQQLTQQVQSKDDLPNTVTIKWHQELCDSMLSEYKQYLQVLGFNSIHVESPEKIDEDQSQQQCYYLKKSMLGGVLLFEIHLAQPFFIVKLRIIECSRLQTKTSSAMVSQFMLSFVDACDEIKINMHLHSFTYDFHLRCIHSYIAGTVPWSSEQGYHLTHFLDDFNKYYSKAPNYARNLVYSDVIAIRNLATPARTLYSYLLSHEKTYGMRVFVMSNEHQEPQDSEYVLVKLQSTPLISYCDAQDTRYIDDFDVALIVSRLDQGAEAEKTEINLKYYLMLTSKRELYPKREVENNKLGKFRTVYSVVKSNSYTQVDSPLEPSPISSGTSRGRKVSRTDSQTTAYSETQAANADCSNASKEFEFKASGTNIVHNITAPIPPPVPNSPLTQNPNVINSQSSLSPQSHLIQIRQESVNYLGYYSSHEQLMQQMIMSQAHAARQHIMNMIDRGALQCRTHLLWSKLLENRSTMTYNEFVELCSLAHIEPLPNLDPRLNPLVSQPIAWHQALSKVLQNKYQEHHKQFNTPDGNVTHHLILHPNFLQAFMMLTIDLHTSRGDLCAVYRKSVEITNTPFSMDDIYDLVEGFVNACCFHLWMGLYSQ